jgi:uncharacterized repeat protein (TIGR04052 family)
MRAIACAATALFFVPLLAAQSVAGTLPQKPVAVRFAGVLGQKPFVCGERYVLDADRSVTVTPSDLRFYVANVELMDASGKSTSITLDQDGIWQYRNIALIDLEDGKGGCRNGNAAMHTTLTGTAPAGSYTGIRFTVGLPFELGHLDPVTSPAPLNFTAMSWVWQTGFKFIRAELLFENEGARDSAVTGSQSSAEARSAAGMNSSGSHMRIKGLPIHIGSTGCVSATKTSAPDKECAHPNRANVLLANFDPDHDTVIFDFDRLLSGSNITQNTPNTAPGCMSGPDDPDCAPIFHALGLPFGSTEAVEQTVFRKQTQ